jgi:hypothetical protein
METVKSVQQEVDATINMALNVEALLTRYHATLNESCGIVNNCGDKDAIKKHTEALEAIGITRDHEDMVWYYSEYDTGVYKAIGRLMSGRCSLSYMINNGMETFEDNAIRDRAILSNMISILNKALAITAKE